MESGIEAYRNGDKPHARAIFLEIIKLNPQDEAAWLWLSACTDVKEQQVYCLNKVLSLNPNNAHAQKGLAVIAALPSSADPASSIQSSEQPVISVQQSTESRPSSLPEVSVTVRHTIDGVKSELHKIGVGKLLMSIINKQLLVETLEDNEQIEHAAQGKYNGDVIVLFVTIKRILLISIASKNFVHKIPYTSISSVQQRSGFAMGILNIISDGSIFEITDIVDNKKSIKIHRLITTNISLIKKEGDGKSLDTITADQIQLTQMKKQIPLFTMKQTIMRSTIFIGLIGAVAFWGYVHWVYPNEPLLPRSVQIIEAPQIIESPPISAIASPMNVRVTSKIVKFIGGKYRYFFDVRNFAVKPFEGSAKIQLLNSKGNIVSEETFTTNKPIQSGGGFSVYFDVHTGSPSVHGEYGIVKFLYKVTVDNQIVASGDGIISDSYEALP